MSLRATAVFVILIDTKERTIVIADRYVEIGCSHAGRHLAKADRLHCRPREINCCELIDGQHFVFGGVKDYMAGSRLGIGDPVNWR